MFATVPGSSINSWDSWFIFNLWKINTCYYTDITCAQQAVIIGDRYMYILSNKSWMLAFQWVCLKNQVSLYIDAHILINVHTWLQSSWGISRARPAWSPSGHILTPALAPFRAPTLEAMLLQRKLFIVLMTAVHISPNIFSLQLSLANVYRTSYYNIQQCTHTYYTSHLHNLIFYYCSQRCQGQV